MIRLHPIIRSLCGTILIIIAYWNIWVFTKNVANLPLRDSDDLVVQENRYREMRNVLLGMGYDNGPIRFITNRDLRSEHPILEDDRRWYQAQYVMVPWILVRNENAVGGPAMLSTAPPFIIGDFWDGKPVDLPQDLIKLYESGTKLVLFRKKSLP